MITLGSTVIAVDDPRLWVAATVLVLFLLLFRAVARSSRAVEPLARHLADLDGAVRALNDGQQQLHGGITHVAEAQAIEKALRQRRQGEAPAFAVVSVGDDGRARLKGVIVDGKRTDLTWW